MVAAAARSGSAVAGEGRGSRPYDCKTSDRESCSKELTNANRANLETANLHAAEEKAKVTGKEVGGGWDPTFTRRSYFPYWRSVLRTRCLMKVYPTYAREDARSGLDLQQFRVSQGSPKVNGSTPTPNLKLGLVGTLSLPVASSHPKRSFGTAAIGAFRLLKMLKHA
nr:unnamed protein product [Digitaria exilis]